MSADDRDVEAGQSADLPDAPAEPAPAPVVTPPPAPVVEPPPAPVVEPPPPPVVAAAPVAPVPAARGSVKGLRVLAWLVVVAGVVLIAAGAVTWFVVKDELGDEQITVSADADHFAGDDVNGPLTAYSEAETINKHTLEASGGKTYAQLGQDDPVRETVMTASFLRASLFTSVVSFGVALFAAGIGVLMLIIGFALLKVCKLLAPLVADRTAAA